FMHNTLFRDGEELPVKPLTTQAGDDKICLAYEVAVSRGEKAELQKLGGYTVSMNHAEDKLIAAAQEVIRKAAEKGYETLLDAQKKAWAGIWEMADITIQ